MHFNIPILLLILCLMGPGAHASYFDQHAEGWHWYEEFPEPAKEPKPPESEPKKKGLSTGAPLKTMKAFKKKVEELKAIAVMNPTFENVKSYMEIQKVLMDRASRFAQRWLEVVYQTPRLDYTLGHPTSQAGRHVYLDEQKRTMEAKIRALSQTHGLFFFFSEKCVYCRQFAPIVKNFAQKYGWHVLAISMDGSRLPEFPTAKNDNGTYVTLGVKALPALLAVDPKSGQVIPLAHGLATQDQIEDRIRVLILRRMP